MAYREIEVVIDEEIGLEGESFLTAKVVENGNVVAGVAVPRDSSAEDISDAFRRNAQETDSQEIRALLDRAADVVPGLGEKQIPG